MDCQPKRMPWIDGCVNSGRILRHLAARAFKGLVLPDHCPQCGHPDEQAGYCRECASGLPRHARQCRICGVPFSGDAICGGCQRCPPPVDRTVAPFKYSSPLSDAVHQLKYHRRIACGRDLGSLLARELASCLDEFPEVLLPVPLHWRRRFQRGFNQSLEIARPVSEALSVPVDARLVRRRLRTSPQVGLMPEQRRRNLRGAFEVRSGPVPPSVGIIDDVVTSGATTSEMAEALRRAGVERVLVYAVIRV